MCRDDWQEESGSRLLNTLVSVGEMRLVVSQQASGGCLCILCTWWAAFISALRHRGNPGHVLPGTTVKHIDCSVIHEEYQQYFSVNEILPVCQSHIYFVSIIIHIWRELAHSLQYFNTLKCWRCYNTCFLSGASPFTVTDYHHFMQWS